MKRFSLLSEQDVLQELDVPTFRHVTKDKLMSFVAMRQCMDPETAQKALEQVPHLTQSLSEILGDYSDLIKQGLASNDEHTRAYMTNNTQFKTLLNTWLNQKKSMISASTYASFTLIAENHLIPYFGKRRIGSITESDVQEYIMYLFEKGRLDDTGGLDREDDP